MKRNLIITLLVVLIVSSLLFINQTVLSVSPKDIKLWVLNFGLFAPVIFIFIYTIRPLILFPASVLSISSGLIFGAVAGTIYTVIGATLGAVLSFLLARKFGTAFIQKKINGKFERLEKNIEDKGFYYILFLRLIPLFNFDLISYLSGITRIKIYSFFLATFIGIIPGAFAYNFLGSSVVSNDWKRILISVVVFIIIIGLSVVIKNKFVASRVHNQKKLN